MVGAVQNINADANKPELGAGKAAMDCHAAFMNMILIRPEELNDQRCILEGNRARHVEKVLNACAGKTLRIGLANGPLGTGLVESVRNGQVVLQCSFEQEVPPRPMVDLLLAMPRPKVMKRLWAQLAALGVGRIMLVRAEKVERYYFDSHVLEPGFYSELLEEGLQQARCTHLPEVEIHPLFKPFVEDELDRRFARCVKLLADPAGERRLSEIVADLDGGTERIILAVGPEGGWTEYERTQLMDRGFKLFGMGRRILRSDTAVVGLLATLDEILSSGPRSRRDASLGR